MNIHEVMSRKNIEDIFGEKAARIEKLHKIVEEAIKEEQLIVQSLMNPPSEQLTTGQRISDKVAQFGGSWKFIISFGIILFSWILFNVLAIGVYKFDPFPFILLNLILSCIAAIQAPIIMMSQNRQEEKDRERSKKDYLINLKSELEIRTLHEKMDHLIMHQQQELIEIQKVQIDMLRDILKRVK